MKSTSKIENIIKKLGERQSSLDVEDIRSLMYSPELFLEKLKKMHIPREQNYTYLPTSKAVIEISNDCKDDCPGCELRDENYLLKRFNLTADEVIEAAKKISNAGINSIILKFGRSSGLDTDIIAYLVYTIKNISGTDLTLAAGLRNFDEYLAWKIAGADSYLIYDCYDRCGRLGFNEVDSHLNYLDRLGYRTSFGKYLDIGTDVTEDLINFILLCDKYNPDMISIEPVLNKLKVDGGKNYMWKIFVALAILRARLREKKIVAHYSYDAIMEGGCREAFQYGSNVYMVDFTPAKYIKMNNKKTSLLYSKARLDINYSLIKSGGIPLIENKTKENHVND